jgi:hypothetical protein
VNWHFLAEWLLSRFVLELRLEAPEKPLSTCRGGSVVFKNECGVFEIEGYGFELA